MICSAAKTGNSSCRFSGVLIVVHQLSAQKKQSYDGKLYPYWAEVVSADNDEATLRGYAYKVYNPDSTFRGWFPLNPTGPTNSTVFSYTYLADTTSGRGHIHPPSRARLVVNANPQSVTLPGSVAIRYQNPTGRSGTLEIYDLQGRKTWRVDLSEGKPGWRNVVWDGCSHSGERVAGGIYFGRIEIGGSTTHVRVFLIR